MRIVSYLVLAIILNLFCLNLAIAESYKKLTLKIDFYGNPTNSEHPLHFNKTVTVDPNQELNIILMTESRIEHNFPVTTTMLVKPVDINDKEVYLRFNLLQYGFNQRGSVITQPYLILTKGQTGELKTDFFTLKVKAKWA